MQQISFCQGHQKIRGGGNSFTENGGPLLCGNKVKTCLNLYTSNSLTPPELLQLKKKIILQKKKNNPARLSSRITVHSSFN